MVALNDFLVKKLSERKQNRLFRELKQSAALIDFSSNDYLGLARSEALFQKISAKLETLNLQKNGAAGSRLLTGNSSYTEAVEDKLAGIFNAEAALIFNSGYTANLAVLSSIPQKDDTVLYDELAHACIKDGARLSFAKRFSFRHNDLNDLESKIKRSNGKIFIAVESIYSMDGDECPLKELTTLAEKYDASIILDEAHSTGVVGKSGSGFAASLGLEDKIAVRIYTFGKAMGIHGACVAGTKILRDYLINFARAFIYTTALPPHSIASIDCAFSFLNDHITLQQTLNKNTNLFLQGTKDLKNRTQSYSAIQTALFPGNDNARNAAKQLQEKGFDVRPILSPTVSEGNERLRICLHTYNTETEIITLTDALKTLATNQSYL